MRYFGIEATDTLAISNQLLTKENNAKRLFTIVAKAGSLSRAQLAKESGLSPSTVSVLTDELIRRGILLEAGAGKSAPTGRKPILLEVDPNGLQIPCFAFRPNGLLYILYDLKYQIIEQRFQPYGPELSRQDNTYISPSDEAILQLFHTVLALSKALDWGKVRVMAISFYGAFLRDASIYSSSVLGWYLSSTFIDRLRTTFHDVPVLIGNVAALSAYAEKAANNDQRDNLLYIHLDEGVGAGIILGNRPFVGDCGISGEIGYMLIDGQRLETIASTSAIITALQEQAGIPDLLAAKAALVAGDPIVTTLLQSVADKVATSINNTLCMLGSMDVFVGGAVAALGPAFLHLLQGAMQKLGFRRVLPHSPLRLSGLPAHGDCLGAAKAYVDNLFTVILP